MEQYKANPCYKTTDIGCHYNKVTYLILDAMKFMIRGVLILTMFWQASEMDRVLSHINSSTVDCRKETVEDRAVGVNSTHSQSASPKNTRGEK